MGFNGLGLQSSQKRLVGSQATRRPSREKEDDKETEGRKKKKGGTVGVVSCRTVYNEEKASTQ
ncbi:hypothetical protein L249_7554 [Ophiocordyceps polyrhachis-furcata BCC 54312]|uniref:Uncharacterized protein n=1 Tax=Ophiocordyceps polyrhachis-furcata BCC 54312 TaxID=1330021 RepID=A0A367LBP0_9HYPO|nr:hypothetical protein L249_7554 [Ophiocordyceps polyrhachis-furcata BCC 54312]